MVDLRAHVVQWGSAGGQGMGDHDSTARCPFPQELLGKVLPVGLRSGAAIPGPPRSRPPVPPKLSFPPLGRGRLVPLRVQISGVELV